MSLSLQDPVYIVREGHAKLEGVVAYLGKVSFNEDDDWVGVRLTGQSAGQGKNNGSVKGVAYFDCPDNCGIFVRTDAVQKRTLTRLEELQLKRELKSSLRPATTSSIPPVRSTPPRTLSGPRSEITGAKASPASESPGLATASGTTETKNKILELRQRRAKLSARKQEVIAEQQQTQAGTTASSSVQVDSSASTATSATTAASTISSAAAGTATTAAPGSSGIPPTSHGHVSATTVVLQQELSQLKEQLASKQKECDALRNDLKAARDEAVQAREVALQASEQVKRLEKEQGEAVAAARTNTPPPPVAPSTCPESEQQQQLIAELKQELSQSRVEIKQLEQRLDEQSNAYQDEMVKARSQISTLQSQLDDNATRSESNTQHYKERAKLQAEIAAVNRKVTQLENEKIDLENTIEDLTLDKEQLEQEKEQLEDMLEEEKLSSESALVQIEELRMELEDAQQQAAAAAEAVGMPSVAAATSTAGTEAPSAAAEAAGQEEVARALSVQNARLREALLRLREQSALEKLELSRQLREVEKDAAVTEDLQQQVETLKSLKMNLEDEINDLKDMVEQGAAFESMVEDLSDRLLAIEDDNIALRSTIRDLEEAAELTAEMEEVQAEELKALTQDLEGRDTIIRNLEEAIKMQRRREEDFLRTVANYRTTVATLKQEKQTLLELQQGGEGEKSHLIASTQQALSRAAQLVSDAAEMRRREARAVVDKINEQTYHHLSFRLESLLPQAVAAPEVSAIKGELLAAKVVSTASRTLDGIASCFGKTIRPALETDQAKTTDTKKIELSDEVRQKVTTMLYQAEFAHVVIGLSSDVLRLLFAGQWSDLLSHEASVELGSLLGHSTEALDLPLAGALKILMEEGALTPEQSNIGALRQTIQVTMQSLKSEIEHEDRMLLPTTWNPPGWELMKNASVAKFACHGAAAAISAIVNQSDNYAAPLALVALYNRVEQASTQSKTIELRLCKLDVNNESLVSELSVLAREWKDASMSLMSSVNEALTSQGDIATCQDCVDQNVLPLLAKLASALRSANLNIPDKEIYHPLSPEADDPWGNVANLSRSIRALEGDEEDVHFLYRARQIENYLDRAVENEPKLEIANARVVSIEKSLVSKTKEVSLLTARLSELEKLLAKSNTSPIARGKALDLRSSEEFNKQQEEIKVLTEAVDVLQRQVDEYENEIRVLKDFKSPGRGTRNRTPRRAITSVSDASPYMRSGGSSFEAGESNTNTSALEATLFRPALQKAIRDGAKWKAAAMNKSMLDLPPLPPTNLLGAVSEDLMELTLAQANYRLEKASVTLVDLTRRDKTPRAQLRESNAKIVAASERLQSIVRRCEGRSF